MEPVAHVGFFVTPLSEHIQPFTIENSIHLRTLVDTVLVPGYRARIPLACSITIPKGYFAVCSPSPYMPMCLNGTGETVTLNGHIARPLYGFLLYPYLVDNFFLPAGSVIAKISLYKCTVENCDHSQGTCN